jgi:hypothetical protein
MSLTLQIVQNGRVVSTLEPGNGTYRIGRDPASDLVLTDPAISKNHATLILDDDKVVIKDNNSANGVLLKGKKIIEHTFTGEFEFEIKPFIIRSAGADADIAVQAEKSKYGFSQLKITNIKASVFGLVIFVMLCTLLIGYLPLKQQVSAIHRREVLKNGIVLSRYLAEMNRPALTAEQFGQTRISPVEKEDGVIYAFMIDAHGRIIAPSEKQGDFFNWKGLTTALEGGQLVIDDGSRAEKIIFYPITQGSRTLGAAIIGFAHSRVAEKTVPGFGAIGFLLLLVLLGIGMGIAYALVNGFLTPLRQLHEEMEIAIKEGSGRLNFDGPYPEIDNIKRTFERLLMRKATAPSTMETKPLMQSADEPPSPPLPSLGARHKKQDTPLPTPVSKTSISDRLRRLKAPWCIIDRVNYTLCGSSEDFAGSFGLTGCKNGMHVIEAFDTDMIQMVSQLIDASTEEEITIDHSDGHHLLRSLCDPADPDHIALILEDKT